METAEKQVTTEELVLTRDIPKGYDSLVNFEELANEAESLLGYSVAKERHINDRLLAQTYQILDEMDIKPFTDESVAEYQKKMANTDDSLTLIKAKKHKNEVIALISSVSLVVTAILGAIVSPLFFIVTLSAGVMVGKVIKRESDIIDSMISLRRSKLEWINTPISKAKDIPEFALQTAVDVTKRLKECKIPHSWSIDELVEVRQPERFIDPFLILSVGDDNSGFEYDLYLEVWNEPDFVQVRKA